MRPQRRTNQYQHKNLSAPPTLDRKHPRYGAGVSPFREENRGGVSLIALQGTYDNGTIRLDFPAPVSKAKALVIFPNEAPAATNEPRKSFAAYRFGAAKGKFDVPDNIDEDNEEIAAM